MDDGYKTWENETFYIILLSFLIDRFDILLIIYVATKKYIFKFYISNKCSPAHVQLVYIKSYIQNVIRK